MGLEEQYGFGARLLKKLGYVEGSGLGKQGQGLATPIEVDTEQTGTHAGLGMLGKRSHVQMDDESSNGSHSSSSEDGEVPEPRHKNVKFKRTSVVESGIGRQLEALDIDLDVQQVLRNPNAQVIIEDIVHRQQTLDNVVKKIAMVQLELDQVENKMEIISNIGDENLSLLQKVEELLKIEDESMVDDLMAQLLNKEFSTLEFSSLDESLLKILLPIVDLLQFTVEGAGNNLNKTQTQLYLILFPKIEAVFKNLDLCNSGQVDQTIYILIEYETVMKFISVYDLVIENFVLPKLQDTLSHWTGEQSASLNYLYDFYVLLNKLQRRKLRSLMKEAFISYCDKWYHRDARPFNCLHFKDIIGTEEFYALSKTHLLPLMIEQLVDGHFDPGYDLESWESINHTIEGPVYCFTMIRDYYDFFDKATCELIVYTMCNEIKKLVKEWQLFGTKDNNKNWRNWLRNMLNAVFNSDKEIQVVEVSQLHELYRAISDGKIDYDRYFDIRDHLKTKKSGPILIDLEKDDDDEIIGIDDDINELQSSGDRDENGYNVSNIPLRRVTPTLREVLQDYCEQHGYIMTRDNTKYTQLPYGSDRNALVPVITIQKIGSPPQRVAIKDDILWIERKTGFEPDYLYNL